MSRGIMENTVNIKTVVHSGCLWAGIKKQRGNQPWNVYSELEGNLPRTLSSPSATEATEQSQVCGEAFI